MWLSGLHIPESYLTALVQATCRKNGWPLDKSTLYTSVTEVHVHTCILNIYLHVLHTCTCMLDIVHVHVCRHVHTWTWTCRCTSNVVCLCGMIIQLFPTCFRLIANFPGHLRALCVGTCTCIDMHGHCYNPIFPFLPL